MPVTKTDHTSTFQLGPQDSAVILRNESRSTELKVPDMADDEEIHESAYYALLCAVMLSEEDLREQVEDRLNQLKVKLNGNQHGSDHVSGSVRRKRS